MANPLFLLTQFDEFVLLLTLLSISSSNIETVFTVVDKDASGKVDAGEFAAVLRLLQDRYQFHPRSRSHSHHPRSTEAGQGKPSGLLISFFGKDQKGLLSVKDFKTFLNDLHEEVVRLEFEHYLPDAKNTIPGIDFARSLVAPCRSAHVETLLDRVSPTSYPYTPSQPQASELMCPLILMFRISFMVCVAAD